MDQFPSCEIAHGRQIVFAVASFNTHLFLSTSVHDFLLGANAREKSLIQLFLWQEDATVPQPLTQSTSDAIVPLQPSYKRHPRTLFLSSSATQSYFPTSIANRAAVSPAGVNYAMCILLRHVATMLTERTNVLLSNLWRF